MIYELIEDSISLSCKTHIKDAIPNTIPQENNAILNDKISAIYPIIGPIIINIILVTNHRILNTVALLSELTKLLIYVAETGLPIPLIAEKINKKGNNHNEIVPVKK